VLHAAIAVWVAQARGHEVVPLVDDLTEAMIPMSNPHFIAAVETVARAWLDAGRTDLVADAAARSAVNAADPHATRLMRASAALLAAWAGGSADSARTAAQLASEHGAPWWELRALSELGDPRSADLEHALGIRT
jgi:hypothetical protein